MKPKQRKTYGSPIYDWNQRNIKEKKDFDWDALLFPIIILLAVSYIGFIIFFVLGELRC